MTRASDLRNFVLCSCAMLSLAGCGAMPSPVVMTSGGTTAGGTSTGGSSSGGSNSVGTTPAKGIPEPSVYVEDDSHTDFYRILVYSASATGPTNLTVAMGDRAHSLSKVSVDAAGNIYVLSSDLTNNGTQTILEYSAASPSAAPVRSLPVGPGTKIPAVLGLSVSPAGEIFVADGNGLSVFSATASGNADPDRHISSSFLMHTSSGLAVDSKDNAYVVNGSDTPIVVYGPTDDGNTSPIRAIGGDLTQLNGGDIGGITTDTSGNLYVACLCAHVFGVLEFGPSANGNTAPIRIIAGPLTGMYPYFASLGIAVDSAGYVYVNAIKANATPQYSLPAIFRFSPTASGDVAPDSIVTLDGWYDSEEPQIAVH